MRNKITLLLTISIIILIILLSSLIIFLNKSSVNLNNNITYDGLPVENGIVGIDNDGINALIVGDIKDVHNESGEISFDLSTQDAKGVNLVQKILLFAPKKTGFQEVYIGLKSKNELIEAETQTYQDPDEIFNVLNKNGNKKSLIFLPLSNFGDSETLNEELLKCNNQFLTYLKSGIGKPNCIPQVVQLNL